MNYTAEFVAKVVAETLKNLSSQESVNPAQEVAAKATEFPASTAKKGKVGRPMRCANEKTNRSIGAMVTEKEFAMLNQWVASRGKPFNRSKAIREAIYALMAQEAD